jgi:NAD(P)-dependent dehydrogenase (short-subunit alcohol dehydrogenase family)
MNSKLRLYNRKVLVTSVSNGIGKDIVDLFLENGAQVIGLDIEPFKNLDTNKKYCDSFNFSQMDVSKEDE